jgi:enoyl-CoA hydratase/carnithine racemase
VATRVVSSRKESILILGLDSDDGYPRLERRVLSDIHREIARLTSSSEFAGAIIHGTDRAFAVGADISELAKLTPTEAFEFSRSGQTVTQEIAQSPRPVIAAIRGYCFGGGLDLALACHVRIATPDATFAHPGGSLGIITGWGGTQRLPRLVGRPRALELFLIGRRVAGDEAREWGLVNAIVPSDDLLEAAIRIAAE